MNQARLTQRVVDRLARESSIDRNAWLPIVGWVSPDGHRFGLAVELLGPSPSPGQLRALAKCLAKLAWDERAELAVFDRPPPSARALTGGHSPVQTPYMLIGPGSDPLRSAASSGRELAARLR